MTSPTVPSPVLAPLSGIRIERGDASPEELAVLTVLLLTRTAATATAHPARHTTPWQPHLFHAPHSWQAP